MTEPPVLLCRGLVKRFGETVAADGDGLEIESGETYGLLGPKGGRYFLNSAESSPNTGSQARRTPEGIPFESARRHPTSIPIWPLLGLGLAALGGSMVPFEVFPDTVRTVAHVTPHAWANDAFAEIVRRGAGLGGVLLELGVLAAYAVALLAAATWRLRRTLTA